MTTGIYKILNKTTGKFYIGSAVNIEARWRWHKYDLRNNQHQNIYLQRAWVKYWEHSFEFIILELCNVNELLIKEQLWLNWFQCFKIEIGYNLTPTAGNSKGVKHSQETRQRMSEAKKKMTDKTKQLMSQQRKGKKHSEEHNAKISASGKGRTLTEETKAKIGAANKGKKASEETRKKISAGNKNLGTKRGKYKPKKGLFDIMSAPPLMNY